MYIYIDVYINIYYMYIYIYLYQVCISWRVLNLVFVEEVKDVRDSCSRFILELKALSSNPSATGSYNILYLDLQFVPY
jgi:hypothetical protein